MIDKKYTKKVREDLISYSSIRREVIKMSGDAQQLAKKAIFAYQRADNKAGDELLDTSKKILLALTVKYCKDPRIVKEGSFHASQEEYAEAKLFSMFVYGKNIGEIKDIKIDSDTFVGGLSDLVGEIYRFAIKSATAKNFDEVERCYKVAEEVVDEMLDMDLTGYNRQKFDQAKQALQKLEQVRYEVSLRK